MAERENILAAAVPITLDGRELILRYRTYAFIRYAEDCGGDLLFDLRQFGTTIAAHYQGGMIESPAPDIWRKVRDIVWAGLIDAQPELTRDQVARMFGMSDWPTLMPAITEAFVKTAPEAAGRPMPAPALEPAPVNGSPLPGGFGSGPESEPPAPGSPPANSAG